MSRVMLRILVVVVVLVIWQLAVLSTGRLTQYPYPLGIFEAGVRTLRNGVLLIAVAESLTRVLTGFVLAACAGIVAGVAIGASHVIDRAVTPIVEALRSIAPIAWIPMAILWFGISGRASIFIVAYAAFFPVALNTARAVRLIDRVHVRAALTLGAGPLLLLRAVILPSALPTILVGARIGMGFAWASIIAAELAMGVKLEVGTNLRVGLGQLMVSTLFVQRDVNALVLYMVVIGIVGLAIDQVLRRVRGVLSPWTA